MENLIDKIQSIFNIFNNFNFQVDIEKKELIAFDFEELNYTLFNEANEIEKILLKIFLTKNDLLLNRINNELLKIKNTNEFFEHGIDVNFEEKNFNVKISLENVKNINEIKLKYINQLINYINSLLDNIKYDKDSSISPISFTNNFDNIAPIEIYKHFKNGLVDKGYLTEIELSEFLKAAFELKMPPKSLFKIKNAPKKASIEAVFYNYYKNIAGKFHGKQKLYSALLGDYFEGFKTSTISSNFSKSVY